MSRIPFEFLIQKRVMPTCNVLFSRYSILHLVSIIFLHDTHRRVEKTMGKEVEERTRESTEMQYNKK